MWGGMQEIKYNKKHRIEVESEFSIEAAIFQFDCKNRKRASEDGGWAQRGTVWSIKEHKGVIKQYVTD